MALTALCELHPGMILTERQGPTGSFFSHKTDDLGRFPKGWCNGKLPKPAYTPYMAQKAEEIRQIIPQQGQTREPVEEKVDWSAKDRQSIAQTAMKSASEIVAALISINHPDYRANPINDTKEMANEFYKQLKKMKADAAEPLPIEPEEELGF